MTYQPQTNMPMVDPDYQRKIDAAQLSEARALWRYWRDEVYSRDRRIVELEEELDTLRRLAVQVHGTGGQHG